MLQPLSSQLITLSLDNKTKQWWICLSEKGRQIPLSVVWLTISQTDRNALLIAHSAQQGGELLLPWTNRNVFDKTILKLNVYGSLMELLTKWVFECSILTSYLSCSSSLFLVVLMQLSTFTQTLYAFDSIWGGQISHCSLHYICLTALAIFTSYLSKESFSYTSCPVKTLDPNLVMLNFSDELKNEAFLQWFRKFSYISRSGYIMARFEGRESDAKLMFL